MSARSAYPCTASTRAPTSGASSATTASISSGGEGHGGALRPQKCCGRPKAAAALNTRELTCYFLLVFFFVVFFFAAGFFVAFFLAAIGAPSSERPFDLKDTFEMDKLGGG